MSVLVTGGAGYIGSHTVYELIKKNYDVIVIDNLSTGHRDAVDNKARFYEGDIKDFDFLDRVLKKEKIDFVIHFAAFSIVAESVTNPLKYYENNICGTMNLLKALKENNIENIVFSSTAAVYGEPKRIPIEETDQTEPKNPYGETKLAIENMLKWAKTAYGLNYVILRYFNACGIDESGKLRERHNPETHLIPIIFEVLEGKREKISIFGNDYNTKDGTCIRDYIHVTDLANAHIKAIEYLGRGGDSDIFNLGNGLGFSVEEVVDAVSRVSGKKIERLVEARRAGDPAILVASNNKARQKLGFNPKYTDIEEIVASMWDNLK